MIRVTKNIYRERTPSIYNSSTFFIHFFQIFQSLFNKGGNRERSRKLFFNALYFFYLEFKYVSPITVFYEIFKRERPMVSLVNRKIGGVNYKIPAPITPFKSFTAVFQLFKKAVFLRPEHKSLQLKFFLELKNIYLSENSFLRKKRLETNRLAYLNQSYIRKKF